MKFKILKNKNFSLLMAGKVVSLFGSNMQQFALSLYVLAITGSATIFSSMIAISILPRLLLSPIAGVFGDWFDRKKSIVFFDFINGLLIGGYAVYFAINGTLSLFSLYILVILLEVTEIFFGASMAAVVPSIVEKEQLFEANSVRSMLTSLCSMLSPLAAGVLYGTVGLLAIFVINAISFTFSAISELFIDIPPTHVKPEKINLAAFKKDLFEGIQIIKENPMIKNIIGIGMVLNFCLASLFSVGLIYIIREILNGSELQYGIFASILSLSLVVSPLLLSKYTQKLKVGKLTILTFFMVASLTLILALVPLSTDFVHYTSNVVPIALITFITFLIGLLVTQANIAVGTLFDTVVPKSFMGRTATVMNLGLTIAVPVGQLLFGVALDRMNPALPIAITGLIILMAVLYYKGAFLREDLVAQTA